jgi:hypothetical protein
MVELSLLTQDVRMDFSGPRVPIEMISGPCGHRLTGDLAGFTPIQAKDNALTGITRADSATENSSSLAAADREHPSAGESTSRIPRIAS